MTKITEAPEVVYLTGSDRLLVADDSSREWAYTAAAGFDVYIIAGQSNATSIAGNEDIDARLDWTHDRIWQWAPDHADVAAAYRHKLVKAADPLLFPENFLSVDVKVSPGSTFAREIVSVTPAGRDIVLIPAAMPGVGLVAGHWEYPGGELFVAAKNAAIACIDGLRGKGLDARLRGIIWVQGENEAQSLTVTPAEYETELPITLEALRSEVPHSDGAFILVGQMNPDWIAAAAATSKSAEIDAVHRKMPELLPRCFFVHGPKGALGTGDIIHYGIQGQRDFGARMVEKARSVAIQTNGAGLTVPTGLANVGSMISWVVPSSDAPLFAIEHRAAGSSGAYIRTLYSPPDYYRPGDTVSYLFTALAGDTEVRVAGFMDGAPGPFTAPIVIDWVAVPQPWARLDFENMTVSAGKVTSVPSTGTNTTAWTAPAGKEPVPADINGHAAIRTTPGDSLLIGPYLPVGAYTLSVLVRHIDLSGEGGAYLSTVEFFTRYMLWRGSASSQRVKASMNGNGAIIESADIIEADKHYVVQQTFDPAWPSGERLKLYVNGVFIGQGAANPWEPSFDGIMLNAKGGTSAGAGNQGGNNGDYEDVQIWTSALTAQQLAQVATMAASDRGVSLG